MKRKFKAVQNVISAMIVVVMIITLSYFTTISAFCLDTTDNHIKILATGQNMSKEVDIYETGSQYEIFDHTKPGFSNLFVSVDIPKGDTGTLTGTSSAEIISDYQEKSILSASGKVEAPIKGVDISASVMGEFNTSCKKNVSNVQNELYEYWEKNIYTRVLKTDWINVDNIEQYFSNSFVKELEKVQNLNDAIAFLNKFGTHVFDRYTFGGKLIITSYTVSSLNIEEVYEEKNVKLGLEAKIAAAVEANNNGESYTFSNDFVQDETTRSSTNMKNWGGDALDALTLETLFAQRGVIAGENAGFMYSTWIQSVKPGANEVVIDVDNPVAIWDIIENSAYHNAERSALIEQAFDILCYINYIEFCKKNDIEHNIIDQIKYSDKSGYKIEINLLDNEIEKIKLPSSAIAHLKIGEIITNQYSSSNIIIDFTRPTPYAQLDGTRLEIADNASGNRIGLSIYLLNIPIYSFEVEIEDTDYIYSGGYGTKNQPYLISGKDQFKSFISTSNSDAYFKLVSNINMRGACLEPGFTNAFSGEFDGNGYKIYNFSIISTTAATNVGLIGINLGTIKNLTLENVRCINSKVLSANEINMGVLVGQNFGELSNIKINNSSIFAVTQMNDKETANIGILCGKSIGNINQCCASSCNILGQTWKKSGVANMGGLVGLADSSIVDLSYVRQTTIYNRGTEDNTDISIGGLVGNINGNSFVSRCIVYENIFENISRDSFGHISGKATDDVSFSNCIAETSTSALVNEAPKSGCQSCVKLRLVDLNSIMKNYWTLDRENKLVLKED